MDSSNAVIVDPGMDATTVVSIDQGSETAFGFEVSDISNMVVTNDGSLEIFLNSGGKVIVENFEELAGNGINIPLSDGTVVETAALYSTLAGTETAGAGDVATGNVGDVGSADVVIISRPAAGSTEEVTLESGQTYSFDFDLFAPETVTENGTALEIAFEDGGLLILNDFAQTQSGALPPELTLADGSVISGEELITTVRLAKTMPEDELLEDIEEPQTAGREQQQVMDITEVAATTEDTPTQNLLEAQINEEITARDMNDAEDVNEIAQELAQTEPAGGEELAQVAQQLAQIEPAAGDQAGGGDRGGFGFQSDVTPVAVGPINAIGPLGPTALQYGVSFQNAQVFPEEFVEIDPLAPPTLLVNGGLDSAEVYEDGSVFVPIVAALDPSNPSGTFLTLTLTGVDPSVFSGPDFTPTGNPGEYELVLPPGDNYDGGITLTPPPQSDIDLSAISVTATATSPATEQVASVNDSFDTIVDAVADEPDVDGDDNSGLEDTPLAVNITGSLGADDFDGSESILKYEIAIQPGAGYSVDDFTFNQGTDLGGGVWEFTPAELTGLEVTPPLDFVGDVPMEVTIFNTEIPVSDREFDDTNDNNQADDTFTLTWFPDLNPPKLTVNNNIDDAVVKEDGSVDVPVTAEFDGTAGAIAGNEVMTLTVSGIDPSWTATLEGEAGSVWTPTGNPGEFAITLPAGVEYDGKFTFEPPADSDLDMTGLNVTASVYDPDLDKTASTSDGFNVITDAVADDPTLSASSPGGEEDSTIDLDITTAVTDTDSSEIIDRIEVDLSDFPAGVTLTAGTQNGDIWTLAPSDLTGLGIKVPHGVTGDFDIKVTSFSQETVVPNDPANEEVDFSDNEADTTKTITITVDPDNVPENVGAANAGEEGVLEALSALELTGTVNADFGDDTPGSFTGSGNYGASGSIQTGTLRSNGVEVTVSFDPATNTYTGAAGTTPVFELVVENDGDYTFKLFEELDHNDPNLNDNTAPDEGDVIQLSFGVNATDDQGDTTEGFINIDVTDDSVIANDDVNTFDATVGSASGNVVSGSGADDPATAKDDLSVDVPNRVTEVDGVAVPQDGSTVDIAGVNGTLTIDMDGNYTYNFTGSLGGGSASYTADPADLEGDNDITVNGITITGSDNLTYVSSDGGGFGVKGGSEKVWPSGESVEVSFDPADQVTFTLADIGTNNLDDSIDFKVTLESGAVVDYVFDLGATTPVGGKVDVTLNAFDFGTDDPITSVEISSVTDPASFLLHGVEVHYAGVDCLEDEFVYTLTDGEGDTETATLTLKAKDLTDTTPVLSAADETAKESDLTPGPEVETGTLVADFFGEGPGVYGTDGAFSENVPSLTSNGETITVTHTSGSYVGESADGREIFTLTVQNNGSYAFTLKDVIDHPEGTPQDQAIELEFGVTATDADGDTGANVITVTVKDDVPSITSAPAIEVDEDAITATNPAEVSGSLAHDYGEDGPGNILAEGNASIVPASGALTSGGDPVLYTTVGNKYIGTAGGETVFELSFENNGDYTFKLFKPFDNAPGSDETNIEFGVKITDFDGDTDTATVAIKIDDDIPKIATPTVGKGLEELDETALAATNPLEVSGKLTVDSGADVPAVVDSNGNFSFGGSVPKEGVVGKLLSNGVDVDVSFDDTTNTYTGAAGTDTVFTMVVEADGSYTFKLFSPLDHADDSDPNDVINLNFPVFVTDNDGDVDGETIVIKVADDAPLAVDDTATVSESAGSASGNVIIANDTESQDTPNSVTKIEFGGTEKDVPAGGFAEIDGDYGTLKIFSNGDYTYTITASNPPDVSESFTYTLTDFDGDSDTADLTLDLEVIDDQPKVDSPSVTLDETDGLASLTASGNVNPDYGADGPGEVTVSGPASSSTALFTNGAAITISETANGYVGETAAGLKAFELLLESDGSYDYNQFVTLDHTDSVDTDSATRNADHDDDRIELTFGFTATDDDGDTKDGDITITVQDDGVDAVNDTVTYDAGLGGASGDVLANDDLSNDLENLVTKIKFGGTVKDVPEGGFAEIDGDNGVLKIFSDGTYEYTVDPAKVSGTGGETFSLDPTQADASGLQDFVERNGIRVEIGDVTTTNPSHVYDISWVNKGEGAGLGIDKTNHNNDSKKVWPSGESFNIGFAQDADTIEITVADIGDNNDNGDKGIDFIVTLKDGTTVSGEQQIVPGQVNGGLFSFNVNSADYGQPIKAIEISSENLSGDQYGAASFTLNNVSYTTPGEQPPECVEDCFEYTLVDGDGDFDTAKLKLKGIVPELIVGENVDDQGNSTTEYRVGEGEGEIIGGKASDILIGDVGGAKVADQDFNVVLILDVSGSMNNNNRIDLLQHAVNNLLGEFNDYNNGEIKVHVIPFANNAKTPGTFTVTNDGDFNAATHFVNDLDANGFTNYEAALQAANHWLSGSEPISGATTLSYFVSDGRPNYYLNDSGHVVKNSDDTAASVAQYTGTADGTNEAGTLKSLSDEVFGVGINIGSDIARIDLIDSDGDAINVTDPNDLDATLDALSPLKDLEAAGDDVIKGGEGNDIIFGDAVNTDALAAAQGIAAEKGTGWDVFAQLESGSGWDRADTLAYIRSNAEELAAESVVGSNNARDGGHDELFGGTGDDMIFGQEGDDLISGGEGNDVLFGGTGADIFLFESIVDGVDTIKDFDESEGDTFGLDALLTQYDPTTEAIEDFVFTREESGNTIVSVDVNGSGNAGAASDLAVLEGVTGVSAEDIVGASASV